MSYSLRYLYPEKLPSFSTTRPEPACSPGLATAAPHVPSLRQCPYHESGGARCEREHGHTGGHTFDDAVFAFLQGRWGLQGPICRTRRGPPEYQYLPGPMCL